MHMFDNHIEKPRSVGRPKLADTKLKKSALILLSMSFVIVITLLLTFGYQLNIIPSLNKLKGVVECSDGDIPVELRYDEETNPNGFKDVNFYSDVINSMNATSCDNVAAADLAEINSINLYNKKYSSINGIQYLTNLERLSVDNNRHLFYLSELVQLFIQDNYHVGVFVAEEMKEVYSINNRVQLAYAAKIMRRRINQKLMLSGVSIEDIDSAYISPDVEIGQDTVIRSNTTILGKSKIGEACSIGPNTILNNVEVGNEAEIISSNLDGVKVENSAKVGPFVEKHGK